jgi:hypothetical protein
VIAKLGQTLKDMVTIWQLLQLDDGVEKFVVFIGELVDSLLKDSPVVHTVRIIRNMFVLAWIGKSRGRAFGTRRSSLGVVDKHRSPALGETPRSWV